MTQAIVKENGGSVTLTLLQQTNNKIWNLIICPTKLWDNI